MFVKVHPKVMLVLAIVLTLKSHGMGDSEQVNQKCMERLTGISTCLPYVGGNAKAPTPDCCSGLVQAINNNKKCICIIIKNRDDPHLGLKISITLALALPSLCKAPGNFALCPALLHLDPKSPEAQAFNIQHGGSEGPSTSPSGTDPFNNILILVVTKGSSQNGGNEKSDDAATPNNSAFYKGKRLVVAIAGLLICFF
ncbi:Protein YLS3, partial [Mucuna pruriens]